MSDTCVRQAKKTRARKRNIAVQLQIALDDAAKAMTADISVQKLAQVRIACLLKMQSRERSAKLEKALATVEKLTVENERLRSELAQALNAKVQRPLTDIERVISDYEKEKQGEQ